MDKNDIVSILQSLLEDYDNIDSINDLTRLVRERWSSESDLALFYDASINYRSEPFEHRLLYNRLEKLVLANVHKEIASIQPMEFSNERDNTALLRMAAYAYVKEYVTIFDVDSLIVDDFLNLAKIDNSFFPYLRQFLKEHYSHAIQDGILRFHPDRHIDDEENQILEDERLYCIQDYLKSKGISAEEDEKKLKYIRDKWPNSGSNGEVDYALFPRCRMPCSESFTKFMQDVFDGNLSEDEIINYVQGKTNSFQTDSLELLLFYVINYIITTPSFFQPISYIEKLKNGLIANGEQPPTIKRYQHYNGRLTTIDDIERLVPEFFQNFRNYYQLRDIIVRKIQENCKIQKSNESQDLTNKKKRNKKDKPLPKQFSDFIKIDDETKRKAFAEFLINELKGKKGKMIAFWIRALNEIRLTNYCKLLEYDENRALYIALSKELGDIGEDWAINKYMDKKTGQPLYKKDYGEIQEKIKAYLSKEKIK